MLLDSSVGYSPRKADGNATSAHQRPECSGRPWRSRRISTVAPGAASLSPGGSGGEVGGDRRSPVVVPTDSVTPMPTVRVAVFDLGSSSFHLMVVDASREGLLVPVLRRRSFLHLGTEVARTGGVPADRAASAVRTVRRLATACEEAGVDVVVALATAALRDADNGSR